MRYERARIVNTSSQHFQGIDVPDDRQDSRFDRIESRLDAMIGKLEHIVAIQAHLTHIIEQNRKTDLRLDELEREREKDRDRIISLENQASNWKAIGAFILTVISGVFIYLFTLIFPAKSAP